MGHISAELAPWTLSMPWLTLVCQIELVQPLPTSEVLRSADDEKEVVSRLFHMNGSFDITEETCPSSEDKVMVPINSMSVPLRPVQHIIGNALQVLDTGLLLQKFSGGFAPNSFMEKILECGSQLKCG